jgi:hypothetical protein
MFSLNQNSSNEPRAWASASQFSEAIQCPQICFLSPILRECEPAFDRLGMPLVTSGQFAFVFKLKNPRTGEAFAVRCFRQHLGDRAERYRAISAHLKNHTVAALSKFEFDECGIMVNGRKYPLLVMPYIEGQTLDVYLAQVLNRKDVIAHLADEWTKAVRALREAQVAHGDLQHGNVIVENGRLHLVDLDGMFVPALEGKEAVEIGHQHFQHPRRTSADFNADLDNFSALSIYVTLLALREKPELWREHHDENLLFTREDFMHPAKSALFAKIKSIGGETEKFAALLEQAALDPDPLRAPDFTQLVETRSNLPAWMTAPLDVRIERRTREAARIDVPAGVKISDEIERRAPPAAVSKVPVPMSVPSQYQTIFSAPQTSALTQMPFSGHGLYYGKPISYHELIPATWEYAAFWRRRAKGGSVVGLLWASMFGLRALFWIFHEYTPFVLLIAAAIWFVVSFLRALEHLEPSSNVSAALPSYTNRAIPTQTLANPLNLIASVSRRVYHLDGCNLVGIIHVTDRAYFTAQRQAQRSGYRPCHICIQKHNLTLPAASSIKQTGEFIGSRSSHIFHEKRCYLVDTIAQVNREFFNTAEEARRANYRPCRICKP